MLMLLVLQIWLRTDCNVELIFFLFSKIEFQVVAAAATTTTKNRWFIRKLGLIYRTGRWFINNNMVNRLIAADCFFIWWIDVKRRCHDRYKPPFITPTFFFLPSSYFVITSISQRPYQKNPFPRAIFQKLNNSWKIENPQNLQQLTKIQFLNS